MDDEQPQTLTPDEVMGHLLGPPLEDARMSLAAYLRTVFNATVSVLMFVILGLFFFLLPLTLLHSGLVDLLASVIGPAAAAGLNLFSKKTGVFEWSMAIGTGTLLWALCQWGVTIPFRKERRRLTAHRRRVAAVAHRVLSHVPPETRTSWKITSGDNKLHTLTIPVPGHSAVRLSWSDEEAVRPHLSLKARDLRARLNLTTLTAPQRLHDSVDEFMQAHFGSIQSDEASAPSEDGTRKARPRTASAAEPSPWSMEVVGEEGFSVMSQQEGHDRVWTLGSMRSVLTGCSVALFICSWLAIQSFQGLDAMTSWPNILIYALVTASLGVALALPNASIIARLMGRWPMALTPEEAPLRVTRHRFEFDGAHLRSAERHIDLTQPFALSLTRQASGSSLVCLSVIQGTQQLRWRVHVDDALIPDNTPTLQASAPTLTAEAFEDHLWPTLSFFAQLHGLAPPLRERVEQDAVEVAHVHATQGR